MPFHSALGLSLLSKTVSFLAGLHSSWVFFCQAGNVLSKLARYTQHLMYASFVLQDACSAKDALSAVFGLVPCGLHGP